MQGTLKSLLQHHSLKASILWRSAFFMGQLSHPYMTTGKTVALTRWTFVGKGMSLLINMEKVTTLFFWAPKSLQVVTAAMKLKDTYSLEVMTNLDSILKSRDITLPTKVHLRKAMVFPVLMHGNESWTIKKAEHRRIDAFELWCWRRLLRVPWTARRSIQPILKEISPEYSLEGLMLKLKLQYFGHLMGRTD